MTNEAELSESGSNSIQFIIHTISSFQTIHFIPFNYHTITLPSFILSFNMGRMYGKGYVLITGLLSESHLSIEREFLLPVFPIREHVLLGVK